MAATVAEFPGSGQARPAGIGQPAPAVEARDLYFSYKRETSLLNNLSISLPAGKVTMLVGPSGSGKTTFLKLIAGLLRPAGGSLRVFGVPAATGRLNPAVAYVPQQLGLVRSQAVLTNVLTGAICRVGFLAGLAGLFPPAIVAEATRLLESLGIGAKRDERAGLLSGGERQRVAIARALIQKPRLILADEFVSQLDVATADTILGLMLAHVESGMSVVMTTHQLELIDKYADHLVVFQHGQVCFNGPPHEISPDQLRAALANDTPHHHAVT